MVRENKVWYLRRSRLFERVGEDVLSGCNHLFTILERGRRTMLFEQGDPAGTVYFLKRGRVRLSRVTADGKEVTIAILGQGDVFGEEALFGETERKTIATVIEDALVCTSRAQDLFGLIATQPAIALNMARYLHEQRDEAISTIEDLAALKVPDRIVRLFQRLADEHGVREQNGNVRITLKLTHADIASLVGSTRETVSVEVGKLRDAGRLTMAGAEFVVLQAAAIGA
ncbi:MAG TPA: Crp/Fnr family transcriptional regulator [Candidatus Sulfotelmatobacter sp.]|nr:Crp/Fnr family transcriptional regulator [Candidatus Sulfotelmatobacter sp.]